MGQERDRGVAAEPTRDRDLEGRHRCRDDTLFLVDELAATNEYLKASGNEGDYRGESCHRAVTVLRALELRLQGNRSSRGRIGLHGRRFPLVHYQLETRVDD